MEDIGYIICKQVSSSIEILKYIQQRRYLLFSRLHEIVFYGKGGYDLDTVYNLPIWLRKFIYHEILKHYEKEAESSRNSGRQTLTNSAPPRGPGVTPRKADITSRRSH